MRYIFLVSTLLFSFTSHSQTDKDSESMVECWKCILASRDHSSEKLDSECGSIAKEYKGTLGGKVAQLIIARSGLEEGDPKFSQILLKTIKFENPTYQSIVLGLQGDCQSEQKNYSKASEFYKKAALKQDHEFLSPMYLFKAYLCDEKTKEGSGQPILTTLEHYYHDFFVQKTLILRWDKNVTDFIKIDRSEANPDDYDTLGFGVAFGKHLNSDGFYKDLEQMKQNSKLYGWKVDEGVVWTENMRKQCSNSVYASAGIVVGQEEFDAFLYGTDGFYVLPDIAQAFRNATTGEFDAALMRERIRELQESPDPEIRKMWLDSKKYYADLRLKTKYEDILQNALFITQLEVQDEYDRSVEVEIEYRKVPYSDVSDEIEISDEEIQKYYNAHITNSEITEYNESYTTVHFLRIPLAPSIKDTTAIQDQLHKLKKEFRSAPNDSVFVWKHSDEKIYYRIPYRPKGEGFKYGNFHYPNELKSAFEGAKQGDIIGPYLDGNYLKIAKVTNAKNQAVTARHILIAANELNPDEVEKARKKAESLLSKINSDNFSEFASIYSEDPGSKDKGGLYEDFLKGEMVKPFNDYAFNAPLNEIGIVQTQFGFHIMEVLSRKPVPYPDLAIISKEIKAIDPSMIHSGVEEQITAIMDELKVETNIPKRTELLSRISEREGLHLGSRGFLINQPYVREDDNFSVQQLLKFAYHNPEIGKMATMVSADGKEMILMMISEIVVHGEPNLDYGYQYIKNQLIRQKKARKIQESEKLETSLKQNATVRLNTFTYGGIDEPYFTSAVVSHDEGESFTFIGAHGVYEVTLLNQKENRSSNPDVIKQHLYNQSKGQMIRDIEKAIMRNAKLIDNRLLHIHGIRL